MILTQRQHNEILEAIRAGGLAPESCRLVDPFEFKSVFAFMGGSTNQARIAHHASGSSFRLWRDTKTAWNYLASINVGRADSFSIGPCEWPQLLNDIRRWAEEVGDEADAPDLWAELQQLAPTLESARAEGVPEAPFTSDEQSEIAEHLDRAREQVRETSGLDEDQTKAIMQSIDELKEKSKDDKITRKDWKLLLYGQAVDLFFNQAVPPHILNAILTTVMNGIGHILGHGGPPVLPPQA